MSLEQTRPSSLEVSKSHAYDLVDRQMAADRVGQSGARVELAEALGEGTVGQGL